MTRSVVFRPEAGTELALPWAWYEEKRAGLGDELVVCVEAAIAGASRDPDLHRRVRGEARRALVRRFPYGVFFVADDDELLVLAIAHDRRSPGYWESRLANEQPCSAVPVSFQVPRPPEPRMARPEPCPIGPLRMVGLAG